jgi:hypothetical protein
VRLSESRKTPGTRTNEHAAPTEKQARIIWVALTGLAIATIVALVVALVWGLGEVLDVLSPVIWPLAVAGVLACLLDPLVDFLVQRKVPRLRAISVVFAMALLLVVGLTASIVPQLVVQSQELAKKTSELTTQLPAKAAKLADNPPKWLPKQGAELLKSLSGMVQTTDTNASGRHRAGGNAHQRARAARTAGLRCRKRARPGRWIPWPIISPGYCRALANGWGRCWALSARCLASLRDWP